MAATGLVALRADHAIPRADEERDALMSLLPATRRGRRDEKWWGWWLAALSPRSSRSPPTGPKPAVRHLQPLGIARSASVRGLHPSSFSGDAVVRADFSNLLHARAQLPGVAASTERSSRQASATTWRVRVDDGARILAREPVVDVQVDVGPAQTMAGAVKLARQHDATVVRFDPHPLLDTYAPLWTGRVSTARLPPTATDRHARARAEVDGRARQAVAADATIRHAIATVAWKAVMRLPASASRQRLLLHKIKGLRLSGSDHGHTFHIMCHCPAARELWSQLSSSWARLGVVQANADAFCDAVFSLRLDQTPRAAWTFLGLAGVATELIPMVHALVAMVWQQQDIGCFEQIWRWRHGVDDEALPWTRRTVASSAIRASPRHAFHQAASSLPVLTRHEQPVRRLLHDLEHLQLEEEPASPLEDHPSMHQYLLFFNGGSRGIRGPGGAGAVVVRTDAFGGRSSFV